MFGLIKKVFITLFSFSGSLTSKANAFGRTKCISLKNQPCMTRPTVIDLNQHEHNQGLRYYPFMISLDRCIGSCNTSSTSCFIK